MACQRLRLSPLPSQWEMWHRAWSEWTARPFLLAIVIAFAASCAPERSLVALEPAPFPPFIYGISVADLSNTWRVRELGLTWMKGYLSWQRIEPVHAAYDWNDL